MAGLSVTFRAVDELSAKMESMANAGNKALDSFERLGNAANNAFSDMDDSTRQIGEAVGQAASATDYWTDAVGNYNRDAMQAVWTTEELVEMGFMTEDALTQAASAVDDNSDSIRNLGDSTSDTKDEMEELGESAERAGKQSKEFGDNAKGAILSLEDVLKTVGVVAALKTIEDAFADCSKEAAAFETSVAMVSTVADTSVLSTAQLSAQITELSMQTGKGVNELAEATYNAISAGVDTSNAVATVGEATKLSTAGFTSSASALSVLTTALNAYQMEASEITNISDSLVMSQNLGVLTIDQMAHSMGKAISTASAYSVDLYNLESGYISLTKAGTSVEESTTYMSALLNELGKNSSKVSKILAEETGESFGKLMEDGKSLADVLAILYESVDRDSEAFMNLWGSAEAAKAGNSIISQGLDTFNRNLTRLTYSAGITQAAYETMTDTAAHATERMGNSFANLKIAIGSDLNPLVSQFQNGIANVVDTITDAINERPEITALLTGAAVGIGTVTLGVTAYTAVTKLATLATAAFGTTMSVALGPLALAAVAIGAVTASIIYMANQEDEAATAQKVYCSSAKDMEDELENLRAEYYALADAQEADSIEAYQLKNRIRDLEEELEKNGKTIGDLIADADELKKAFDEITSSYDATIKSIDEGESDAKSLIAQLAAIESSSNLSGSQLDVMKNIVDRLNSSYEDLNLTLDETNGKLNMSVEDLWKIVTEEAEKNRAQANMDALINYIEQYQQAQKTYQEANETMNREMQATSDLYDEIVNERFPQDHPILNWLGWAKGAEMNYYSDYTRQIGVSAMANIALERSKNAFDELDASIRKCYETMGYTTEEIDQMMVELAMASAQASTTTEVMEKSAKEISDGYYEAKGVIEGFKDKIEELCTAYDNAYESAKSSLDGQIGLFEVMKTETDLTVKDMEKALDSQLSFITKYTENLKKASEYGFDANLISALSDGTAESAGQLDAIIKKVEKLGATTEDMPEKAADFVLEFNEKYKLVEDAKDTWASNVASMQTDFENAMDAIEKEMEETIEHLDLSGAAQANAKNTMDAYVKEIEDGVRRAQSAIDSLNFANENLEYGEYHGKAFNGASPSGSVGAAWLFDGYGDTSGAGYTDYSQYLPKGNGEAGTSTGTASGTESIGAGVLFDGYATGTDYAEPGIKLVGEEGPELVNFHGGEVVYPADETATIIQKLTSVAYDPTPLEMSDILNMFRGRLDEIDFSVPEISMYAGEPSKITERFSEKSVFDKTTFEMKSPEAELPNDDYSVNTEFGWLTSFIERLFPRAETLGMPSLFDGYASGTDHAEPGIRLVGENGPELIETMNQFYNSNTEYVGGDSFTQLTHAAMDGRQRENDENILYVPGGNASNVTENRNNSVYNAGDVFYAPSEYRESGDGRSEKVITLRIEGAGEMNVGMSGGVSKEDVVDLLASNLKNTLMDIIQTEINEEGVLAYDF